MIKICEFTEKDIPELLSWLENTNAEFLIQFAGRKYCFPLTKDQILENMRNTNTHRVYKAVESMSNRTLGHCQLMSINHKTKSSKVGRVIVPHEFRGKNLGYLMLQALIKKSVSDFNLSTFFLGVFDFNIAAINCYKRLGFVEVERKKYELGFNSKIWTVINMQLDIE